jgi:alpha-N-arabinofuranosidase
MSSAIIKIDPTRQLGTIDRRVYGNFMEHLGRCIYGGVYEPGSPLSDEKGYRRDVLEAVKGLRVPLLRWPGGNFASGYHWMDGIGPITERPRRTELAWHAEEPNTFGTHEFIEYCRLTGAEPYICLNLGTGTIDEALAWVEYCNGTGNTAWVNQRTKNGSQEPFRVKLWGLGNEMYGEWQIGHKTAEEYCRFAIEVARVLKLFDPTIQLVSCGMDGLSDWDQVVLDALAPMCDYHSIHIYTGSADYLSNVFAPHQAERALRVMRGALEKARYHRKDRKPVKIAYDEWNVWYRARDNRLEEIYDLSDALAVATFLNIFQRNSDLVAIANYAQLVNVIASIFSSPQRLYLQTTYFPLQLYAQHMGEFSLDAHVECDGHTLSQEDERSSPWAHRVWDLSPFPWLDVSATVDDSGRQVTLGIVNRSPDEEIETTLQTVEGRWGSRITTYEVNGRDVHTVNSFEHPDEVAIVGKVLEVPNSNRATVVFPAHSLTVLKAEIT